MFVRSIVIIATTLLGAATATTTCNDGTQNGICIDTSSCSGRSTAGLCPGASNIQCCTFGSCSNNGETGTCESTSTCSGTIASGLCPGPSEIQCCTSGVGGGGGGGSGTCPPPLNSAALSQLKQYEAFRASPYDDGYGYLTVGYGHKCLNSACSETGYSYPMTEPQGQQLLDSDLQQFKECINNNIPPVVLNDNQYGALASFTFNLGCSGMVDTTFYRRLEAGEDPNTVAGEEFPKFVYSNGQKAPGLVTRRQNEVRLFQTASDVQAIPC